MVSNRLVTFSSPVKNDLPCSTDKYGTVVEGVRTDFVLLIVLLIVTISNNEADAHSCFAFAALHTS